MIKTAKVMPSAQVRFKRRFKSLMETSARAIGAVVLRYAEDDVVPVERIGQVSGEALAILDQLFLGDGGRQPVRSDGLPQSPYARVLLEEIGLATYQMVEAHHGYLRKVMPGDIRLWLETSGRPVREMSMARHVSTLLSELTEDEVRERFPGLTEEDITRVVNERIFDSNRLAKYERAHTWVDPRGYRLSDRIWRVDQRTRNKLDDLLVDGISSGMSARRLANLVDQYLIPGREKVRTNRPYGSDGSYDAMRLARTEIASAANRAAYISSYMNPYVDSIEVVRSANGDRTCTVCPQHATIGFSGERLRPAYSIHSANIPPYHPHDMCRVQANATNDVRVVEDRLRHLLERSREVNLAPVMSPANIQGFMQQLLGEALWNILRQNLLTQPRLI